MAEEQGAFDFGDVVEAITAKLIRRHPHVFADAEGRTAEAVKGMWERIKAEEKAKPSAARRRETGALAGVPVALPALTRALKLQNKAGRVGFDWNDPRAVLAKIREEADEIEAELDGADQAQAAAEVGDLLFAVVNLARHLGADPEGILRATNLKFERRLPSIEKALAARGKTAARTQPWPRWMRCGMRRRRPKKRRCERLTRLPVFVRARMSAFMASARTSTAICPSSRISRDSTSACR